MVFSNALAFEHHFENLRHALVLEDSPVRAKAGAGQLRFDDGAVAGAMRATIGLAERADQTMNMPQGAVRTADGEQCRLVE